MINPFAEIHWNPGTDERRSFARSWVVGFPVLAVFFSLALRWKHGAWAAWPLWLGAGGFALGALLWLVPRIARPLYVAWHFVGCCVGFVVGNAVFIAVCYFAVTPVGLILRALGRDPLKRRFERDAATYWEPVEKSVDVRRYFRQY